MSRSKSILSTFMLLVGAVALFGISVHALRVWQAHSAIDRALGESSEVVDDSATKPVQLWHEGTKSKPTVAVDSKPSRAEPPTKPSQNEGTGSRFAWVLTPRDPSTAVAVQSKELPQEAPAELGPEDANTPSAPLEFIGATASRLQGDVRGASMSPPGAPATTRLLLTSTDENETPETLASELPASEAIPTLPNGADSAVADASPSDDRAAGQPATPAAQEPATEEPTQAEGSMVREAREPVLRAKVARPQQNQEQPTRPTTIQEAPVVEGLESSRAWPQAQALRAALTNLASDPDGNAWSSQVSAALEKLEAAPSFESPESTAALQQLRALSDAARKQVAAEEASPLHTRLLRANYSLQRRLAIWESIHGAGAPPPTATLTMNRQELAVATSGVDAFLAASGRQQEWRKFLLLEDVVDTIRDSNDVTSANGRALARCILARLDSTLLTPQQAKFLDRPAVHRWIALLQQWAVESVDHASLLRVVERYESNPSITAARDIARANQVLRWAPNEKLTDVGTQLNLHYRNANVRLAVASDLANRLLPPLRQFDAPVDDVIRNTRVVGRSQTAARSRLVLFADRTRWSMGLDVLGSVASETQGQRGPAVFFQDGQARFHARKLVQVDHQGVHTKAAFAVAESTSQLTGVETDFDGVPLMNRLARSIAQKQYEGESSAAQPEVDERIANEASKRLDDEVRQLLADTQKRVETQVLRPLADLGLEPTPIDFETTRTRLITRYRIAGSHQLAAHSPRPQAPSNSLMSLQLHESALNNVIEQLRFDGRQVELPDLMRELASRLGRKEVTLPEDLPENVNVQFANEDAVRVTFDVGRVTITLQVVELSQGRDNRWKNFIVRAHYVPRVVGRQVELVRDGVIELGGDRRRIGDQVALRAIFAKVLSKNRPIPLLPTTLVERPELSDVEASQAVVEDGWIGITLAQGGSVARQPTTQSQR